MLRLAFLRSVGCGIGFLLALSLLSNNSTTKVAFVLNVLVLVWYALASLSLRRALRGTKDGVVPSNILESTARGAMIGLNAGVQFGFWVMVTPDDRGALLGAAIASLGLLSAIPALARSAPYQTALGWTSWLMPMSWPVTGLGLVLFLASLVTASRFRPVRVRVDETTGTVETSGGIARVLGFAGGFNLGNFTFLVGAEPTSFQGPGISSHETGHTLNVAAFGSVWHLAGNAVEQNLRPFGRGVAAYGELLAESHRPRASHPTLLQWSPELPA